MDTHNSSLIQTLRCHAASLLLYQSVLDNEVGQAFLYLLQTLSDSVDQISCLQAYGNYFKALAASHQSWQDYLTTQILHDDNPFSQQVQQTEAVPPALLAAAKQDLQALQKLYQCSSDILSQWVQVATGLHTPLAVWDHQAKERCEVPFHHTENWESLISDLAAYYRKFGTGLFANRALRWQAGRFVGILHPDTIQLDQLVGYELQKETLLKNTEFLLSGYSALHVLLYGSRGSGKSSLVKALLNQYQDRNLRLIEVAKFDLKDLPEIVEKLRSIPQKFIIFVDDLSFEEDDDAFKALKVVLEGNLTARPQNVIVYATSNRRHLIREFFTDRPQARDREEVHAWDTMQEKLSFSDRFGLTLTFEPADQKTYLSMIRHLAAQAGISISQEDLEYRALQWATRHNGRSGRTARQFVNFLKAELDLFSG
ncbi:ATP-binding protein [Gloeocapsopsis dulcis]|uniref:AAA+ family ATPase n=1 Tax=Gloeocapsopsis dulcis AAB1 = 1H9 TaxID=1433147 RepID=A0A6N8G2M5_9CHRO|nr:ATP-binding protein [Gloeocapsopsis dulcis]MUL38426.1 AAA+ family ATPase [Gloeocapsopsis dulcis AAB1 = 1H9]WNN89752.1 ATP-binding protein [Gloeocapsopsis dulcis]